MVLQSLVHPARTLEELNKQRKQNIFTDITILVSDEKFPAHRALLAAHSSLFRSVLQESSVAGSSLSLVLHTDLGVARAGHFGPVLPRCHRELPYSADWDNAPNINLDGVEAAYFSILLDFIYTAKLCVNAKNVDQVSATSSFLQISSVVELCEKFKQANLKNEVKCNEIASPNNEAHTLKTGSNPSELASTETSLSGEMSCITDEKTQIEIELSESGVAEKHEQLASAEVQSITLAEKLTSNGERKGRKAVSRYKCPLCDKHMTLHKLESHVRMHTGEKPAQCSYCQRSFANIYNLRIHERSHTGERPYQCPQCDKTFADPSTLCKHKLWHAGIKKKKCMQCEKLFSTSAQVKEHMKTHTKEKPFKCPHCDKSYAYKCDYKRHLREHTGDLFGPCMYCGRYFNHGGNYKVHLRNHEKRADRVIDVQNPGITSQENSILKVDDLAQLMSQGHAIEVMIDENLLVKPAPTLQTNQSEHHSIVMSQDDEIVSATVSLQQGMAREDQLTQSHCDVMGNDYETPLVIAEQTIDKKL